MTANKKTFSHKERLRGSDFIEDEIAGVHDGRGPCWKAQAGNYK